MRQESWEQRNGLVGGWGKEQREQFGMQGPVWGKRMGSRRCQSTSAGGSMWTGSGAGAGAGGAGSGGGAATIYNDYIKI